MPTQSPTPLTPKDSRNNRRNQKRNITASAQNVSALATPPSSPPKAVSPREATTDSSSAIIFKKKGNRSAKKLRDISRMSPVNKPGHRHTSSQSNNNIATSHMKETHYAGPTFHASPAPSALPIPSFFSKSFPESDLAPAFEQDSDSFDADGDLENTPSKPRSRPLLSHEQRESTPLDFLFKAAVEARMSGPQQSPDQSPCFRSPQTDSKAMQHRKFNNDNAGIFPLEMGGSDLNQPQIGPSFAPSYKDRMNALQSASSVSPDLHSLDENERKAKTEALKSLLLNPRPQRPSLTSQSHHDQFNYKRERPILSPMVPHFATPLRTSSGPPVMTSNGDMLDKGSSVSKFGPRQSTHDTHSSSPQRQYLPDSTILANGILASNPGNAPTTPRQAYNLPSRVYPSEMPAPRQHANYYPAFDTKSPAFQPPPANASSPAVDTKKIEDDLRRILKLDVNPSIPSSEIQSSLA
ncbi:hypothetical protein AN8845.2 [Aspergillus nidulans FGSC A4]|uniref:Uncharacterized protein n=1 Tax=Emericella nidulans (strain FGSC A4 / ATCC 38163 / CBS 112.46 / NRRL 194 / M139) TaxID=227321 RepID=Q5AS85_EMENI|nr:hypothetical protein [Aspergillus nidulans FGSC A4]EAA60133.1 hypothetical protein AN8845.2 [Aspergillus nidulans FGSC A4]CBF77894.1 TPA: conserved hypothetical protein [Aspergillus nidulans FGSC A4]|eukprot:XP_682114.1 hypothetical protein AN8845.2 [Aspergillus nidulans FGSC A4]